MYAALLSCAVIDFALSYNYYLTNTSVFVNSESNIEFVNFLTQGTFPFNNCIKFILALPLLLFLLSWFDAIHENINNSAMSILERSGRIFTIAIPCLFCVSYSVSGFTWYTNSQVIYEILSVIEILIHGSILFTIVLLFLLTVSLLLVQEKIPSKRATIVENV